MLFLEGNLGILFYELAITLCGAVVISSILALSLTPMMSSKLLTSRAHESWLTHHVDVFFRWLQRGYHDALQVCLRLSWVTVASLFLFLVFGAIYMLFQQLPTAFAPSEDQGVIFASIQGPEGANLSYMERQVNSIQDQVLPYIDEGEVQNIVTMTPGWGVAAE